MKAAKDRPECDDAEALNRPMEWGILVQRAMNARFIIISGILAQDPAQVRLPDQRRAGPVSVPTPMSRRSCARTEEQPVTEKILITPTDLSSLANGRATVLIDTRDPAAYAAGHLPGAVNIHDRKNCC
jgi:hypothetical protein